MANLRLLRLLNSLHLEDVTARQIGGCYPDVAACYADFFVGYPAEPPFYSSTKARHAAMFTLLEKDRGKP